MDSRSPTVERATRSGTVARRWRLFGIALWSAFLGATLNLLVAVALLPQALTAGLGWDGLSIAFLCSWLLTAVAVALALVLAAPLFGSGRDGR